MSESWKIKNWDYVLDGENAKIPQFLMIQAVMLIIKRMSRVL